MATVVSKAKKHRQPSAIGVLNLQGGVCEHLDHLERLGVACRPVKIPADFEGLAGLIIPGGESTCLARLLHIFEIDKVIVREFRRGMKLWGTCAGAIVLARVVVGEQPVLGLIDIEVERNSFGSQLDSFRDDARIPAFSSRPLPLTFIRAPQIKKAGKGVKVLLKKDNYIAAAESRDVLVTVFHPELTGCVAFHRYFARKCGLDPYDEKKVPDIDPTWNPVSWTRLAPVSR
ncbi:MAG: pyridoxal 5'-phosphate synthase glutaminase subunit PdxT [Deltaproteobacteria bacterium]|nr:pyridoxal 5'-phosphate synthase glutaminase subunit PdxT [Deltaproteobacteria bacterium]